MAFQPRADVFSDWKKTIKKNQVVSKTISHQLHLRMLS